MKSPYKPPRDMFPSNTEMMRMLGFEPDPWQVEVLETPHKRLLLNCCRQSGKSTVVAVLGLVEALFNPLHKVVIVAPSMRQSTNLTASPSRTPRGPCCRPAARRAARTARATAAAPCR